MNLNKKEKKFNKALQAANKALKSINIKFHLHSGTALGLWRNQNFIKHDQDIDLAIFKDDITLKDIKKIKKSMKMNDFYLLHKLGIFKDSLELSFVYKNKVKIDIFVVYKSKYKKKKIFYVSSFFGFCDLLPKKICIWGYSPYKVQKKLFLGKYYFVVPQKTLVDMYGLDWKTPKKFNYDEGVEEGHYKGLIKDFFKRKKSK